MKKILFLSVALIVGTSSLAETLKVEAITSFTTKNPPKNVQLKAKDEIQLTDDIKIQKGDILSGYLIDIKKPKRLKRNATFNYEIKTITNSAGQTVNIEENNVAKFVPSMHIDKKELAKNAALSVGNHFVEGLSVSYHLVEGAVNSESGLGNRMTSAVESAYDNSILSYIRKGKEVVINTGDIFGLKINSNDEIKKYNAKHAPNYSYELK